ncbi:unnamed protein product [Phytophthora fragariaefolia]|uniref:Unnamed protein product n=1 Tax=Phytophthora fragariaefolia TaxID=1490495 RepID=A0A9W6WU14_9STRA|nr:unnamed protein product [Phytophthora fragariaefolia]
MLSYITHRKVYTPKSLHTEASSSRFDQMLRCIFKQQFKKCLEELLHRQSLVWIDDLLLLASDVKTYLAKMKRLFELLDFFGFKLSVKKSCLFKNEVRWCGKIITGTGVRHDPECVRALQALPYPTTAAELQQFLCATNWMRDSLIDYARKTRPPQEVLDTALATAKDARSGSLLELRSSLPMTNEQHAMLGNNY